MNVHMSEAIRTHGEYHKATEVWVRGTNVKTVKMRPKVLEDYLVEKD